MPAAFRAVRIAVLATGLLYVGCGGPDDTVVELGRLQFRDYAPMIAVPTSAATGESFNVMVTTYGGGCISFESTDVTVSENDAEYYVYDRRQIPGDDEGCTLELTNIPHHSTLMFSSPGNKVIHFHGRKYAPPVDEDLEVTREVLVQ